jgi:hypothetical protein
VRTGIHAIALSVNRNTLPGITSPLTSAWAAWADGSGPGGFGGASARFQNGTRRIPSSFFVDKMKALV